MACATKFPWNALEFGFLARAHFGFSLKFIVTVHGVEIRARARVRARARKKETLKKLAKSSQWLVGFLYVYV